MDTLVDQELEQLLEDLLLGDIDYLPLHHLDSLQGIIPREADPSLLMSLEISPLSTELRFERDLTSGELIGFKEVSAEGSDERGERITATSSVSLSREPGSASDGVKGNPNNLPFKPPALELHEKSLELIASDSSSNHSLDLIDFEDLLRIPPGSLKGLPVPAEIDPELKALFSFSEDDEHQLLADILEDVEKISSSPEKEMPVTPTETGDLVMETTLNDIKELSIKDVDSQSAKSNNLKSTEWAEIMPVNVKMKDMKDLITNPAFEYPFELDTFQKQAVLCLEDHKNVFVAAHTSAGKTVVAEYAIAMSIRRNMTRVIYTSPIKALSNQKFRDFRITFGLKEIGLLTGDIQIQPEAPCLIMTTEILLQMLYNGSDVIRDLEWVIFDEVHYCNDPERGHVWEKVFIMLPDHISLVLLSATVNNVAEYADWLGRTRNKKTYVMSTIKRPVPLEHFLYIGAAGRSQDTFLLINSEGKLLKDNYNLAIETKKERTSKRKQTFGPKRSQFSINPRAELNLYISCIRTLEKNVQLPVIVFTLSRKRCDYNGNTLSQAMDLTTADEKGRIHNYIFKSLLKLKPIDRQVPQVKNTIQMLKNGFGVHHSGILPILKEITEILFGENLIRVLFATETFAMGVNMPARTVAFDSIRKHDGRNLRNLDAHEYIQMAGRAGRRGKDKTGNVLILCKADIPELGELVQMALGKPIPLESQFRLTYSMILNLLRCRHHLKIQSVMSKSFDEHKKQVEYSELVKKQDAMKVKQEALQLPDCSNCATDLDKFSAEYLIYKKWLAKCMIDIFVTSLIKNAFEPGRLLLIETPFNPFAVAVVTDIRSFPKKENTEVTVLIIDIFELMANGADIEKVTVSVERIRYPVIHLIFGKVFKNVNTIKIIRESSSAPNEREATIECLTLLREFFSETEHQVSVSTISGLFFLKSIDPVRELGLNSLDFSEKHDRLKISRNALMACECIICPSFVRHFRIMLEKAKLELEQSLVSFNMSTDSLKHLPEYNMRLQVLEKLGYINAEGVLEMKGKVACLMSEHELIITELLVANMLGVLSPVEIASVMSGFVFQQKAGNKQNLSPTLEETKLKVQEIEKRIELAEKESGLRQGAKDSDEELNFGLMEVVFEWAKGTPFSQVVTYTDVQEGIIVRTIQRLDEMLKDVKSAAKLIGDPSLADKVDSASKCIRRDIVFAASLYTQAEAE